MAAEQLIFLLVLVLIPLLNFLARVLRRAPDEPPAPLEPGPRKAPARVLPARPSTHPERGPSPAASPPPPPPPAPARPRWRLTPEAVRRGIVLMTILGPCPGLESASPAMRPPARRARAGGR